ncbi:MAG: diacylglycerol kinase [Gammaproteobacteria bacterium]|nr:diacylglycerol kinase [Gammaproteobacteria bacterium]
MRSILENDDRLVLQELEPSEFRKALNKEVKAGRPRVIVSGGDGTLALAASCLVGTDTALAVLPGGTLNHFAKRIGLPEDSGEALEIALNGQAKPVGVGCVNGEVFINTFSVGAYVSFVRTRDYLQRRMSYRLASLVAALRRFAELQSSTLLLDGKRLRTPQLFVGVDERELQFPRMGVAHDDSSAGLHLMAVLSQGRLDSLLTAMKLLTQGTDVVRRAENIDTDLKNTFIVDHPQKNKKMRVAIDGELVFIETPLRLSYKPEALRVIV